MQVKDTARAVKKWEWVRWQIYEPSEISVTHLKTDRLDKDFHCVQERFGSQNAAGRSINGAII
eukprot:6206002-Pleurochrysis_carterae.AAC.1